MLQRVYTTPFLWLDGDQFIGVSPYSMDACAIALDLTPTKASHADSDTHHLFLCS